MDFEDTPDEAAFRAEARAFLEANAERRKPGAVEGYRYPTPLAMAVISRQPSRSDWVSRSVEPPCPEAASR